MLMNCIIACNIKRTPKYVCFRKLSSEDGMRPYEHVLNALWLICNFPSLHMQIYNHDVKYCREQWKSSANAVPDVVWFSASLPSHLLNKTFSFQKTAKST